VHAANLAGGADNTEGSGDHRATIADVVSCYRLLLGRAPDEEGIAHYRRRLREGLSISQLVGEFLGSVEFARAHLGGQRTTKVFTETVPTAEGFRIDVDPSDFAVGHTIARTGIYEPEVCEVVRRYLGAGQCFVDIGANIGWFSLLAAAIVGPAGRVVAVEPNPSSTAMLRQSAKENGFDNIEIVEVALSAESGVAALETDGSNGRVIPIEGPPARPLEASFVVPLQPLDLVLRVGGVARADVVKLDVEGAEPLVLRGGKETIARDRPVLITEFFPLALEGTPWGGSREYLSQLRGLGYGLSVISRGRTAFHDEDDSALLDAAAAAGQLNILALPVG
jgi:FkbM family methyltransferase